MQEFAITGHSLIARAVACLLCVPLLGIVLLYGCKTAGTTSLPTTSLPFSKSDRTTQASGDSTDYGPRQHFEHIVRDRNGQPIDIYRYYLDDRGKPVLDGKREMRRWEHDPGHMILYRDGRVIREADDIIL